MARAAEEALVKIGSVLPDSEKDRTARTEIHAPMWVVSDADRSVLRGYEKMLREANSKWPRSSSATTPRVPLLT